MYAWIDSEYPKVNDERNVIEDTINVFCSPCNCIDRKGTQWKSSYTISNMIHFTIL